MKDNLRPYLVELCGTFALVFMSSAVVCIDYMAAVRWQPHPSPPEYVIVQPQPGLAGIALACGLVYAAALAAALFWSEGYLNPVIPLTLWVYRRMDTAKAFGFIFVQILGAVLAGGLVFFIFSFRDDVMTAAEFGTPHLNLRVFDAVGITRGASLAGIGMELGLTLILTFVIFATLIDPRAKQWLGSGARRWGCAWAGVTLAAATLAGFNLTGAALNPARWLGPMVWEYGVDSLAALRPARDHIVYWFGPIAGALIAGGIYITWILPAEPEITPATSPSGARVATGAALSRSRK